MNIRQCMQSIALAILTFCFGCASSPATQNMAAVSGNNADEFLIVDCLLPGQIRQLGTQMRFMTARRPIKTSVRDCGIRGGEYVAEDRGSYGAALKAWLPLAEQGDKIAQTNLGEIYEKGLGLTPDYKAAAVWYQKAADQQYPRAQINLGQLYEQGQGVEKDPYKAVNLYRLAAGIDDAVIIENETLEEERRETEQLRATVQQQKAETEFLRQQLNDTQHQLDKARGSLQQRQDEANSDRRTLDKLRAELNRMESNTGYVDDGAIAKLKDNLKIREDAIRRRDMEIDGLRNEITRVESEASRHELQLKEFGDRAGDKDAELQAMRQEVASSKETIRALDKQLAQSRQHEQTVQQETTQRHSEIKVIQQELVETQAALAQMKQTGARDKTGISQLEQILVAKQSQLTLEQQQVARLNQEVQRVKSESQHYRDMLAKIEAERKRRLETADSPDISIIEPHLAVTRDGLKTAQLRTGIAARLVVGKVVAAAGLVSVTINDRGVEPNDTGVFQLNVPIKDTRTPVTVVAVDKRGQRTISKFDFITDNIVVEGAAQTVSSKGLTDIKFGAFHALIIGNNEYASLPDLNTAVNDAETVDNLLRVKYGFKTKKVINANRYQILSALNEFREKLTEKDNFLLYYAGHGELDRVNQRGHWLPVDAESDSTANWISNVAVTDILNAMSAKQILVVADSCYSGSLTRNALAQLDPGLSSEAKLNWIKVLVKKRARTVLSSGGEKPVLDTTGGTHSVFARAFLDTLEGNSELLEGRRLFKEVTRKVSVATANVDFEQIPAYSPIRYAGHEGGDFFFVPKELIIGWRSSPVALTIR